MNLGQKKSLISGCLMAACATVSAQEAIEPESQAESQMENLVVTGQAVPYRGNVPLASLPQQIQVLPSATLEQAGKYEFQNALDLAGGVARQNSFGGLWDSFAIRGFAGDENLPSAYLINGFSGGRGYSGNRDTSNIDYIEILKGPGSALYGRGEPGGTINVITKKPEFEREGHVSLSAGRYDNYRLEGDYTDAITDNVAFRINGSYRDSESFRDTVESEKLVLTPSILVQFNNATSLNYELEYLDQQAPFDRGIVAIESDPEVVDISTFYGEPQDGPIDIDAIGHQLVLQHDLNVDWTVQAGLGYRTSSFKGQSSETELSGGRQILTNSTIQANEGVGPNEFVNRQIRNRDYEAEDLSARLELIGVFDTGNVTHHVLAGIDAYDYELDTVQLRWRDAWETSTYYVNVHNPVYGQPQTLLASEPTVTDRLETQENVGLYIQDQMDLTSQLKLLLGLRFDDFSQKITNRSNGDIAENEENALSSRVGVVYDITHNVSVYASYGEGFRPNSGADASGNSFEPEESESKEIGVKFGAIDGKLSTTIAVFQMEKSNVLTADPVNSGFSAAIGAAESEGLEIDVVGDITDSLHLLFNYAYVNAGTKTDLFNADWAVNIPAGNELVNIPQHQANLLISKDLMIANRASSLGFSINYVDDRLGGLVDPITGQPSDFRLPSYTLLNAFGAHQVTNNVNLSLNIDNITNEKHYVSSYNKWWITPGAPLTWTVKGTYSF